MFKVQFRRPVGAFWSDTNGATAVVFALSLPVFLGAAGLGVETGYWYLKNRELQTAADIAAHTGAVELRGGKTADVVRDTATHEAQLQGFDPARGTATVNTPPGSGTHTDGHSVEVLLTQRVDRFFSQLFNPTPVVLNARAVSSYDQQGIACVLALDTWANDAVIVIGNPTTTFTDCNIMSNSLADDSITIAGSADVTAPCIVSAGGTDVTADLTLTECAAPLEDMPQAADPYKTLPEPPIPASCSSVPHGPPHTLVTLSPGKFCGGMSLNGDYHFNSGTYIIDGGDFSINAGSVVDGANVTFFLTNGARLRFNGSAQINLSAPTSGTYSGVLMYGDRDQANATNIMNGTAASRLTGALYFPSQEVQHNGNFSGVNGCMQIVARKIDLQGNANFNSNCAGTGMASVTIPGNVRLVE